MNYSNKILIACAIFLASTNGTLAEEATSHPIQQNEISSSLKFYLTVVKNDDTVILTSETIVKENKETNIKALLVKHKTAYCEKNVCGSISSTTGFYSMIKYKQKDLNTYDVYLDGFYSEPEDTDYDKIKFGEFKKTIEMTKNEKKMVDKINVESKENPLELNNITIYLEIKNEEQN